MNQTKLRAFVLTVPIIIAATVGLNVIHEYGHYLTCESYGHDCTIYISPFGAGVSICRDCDGMEQLQRSTISVMGGGVGTLAGLAFLVFRQPWIRVPLIAGISAQATMMMLETFVHNWYIESPIASQVIGIAFLVPYMVLVIKWIILGKEEVKQNVNTNTATA